MDGPQDDFEETHNVRVLPKGAPPGGFISRLQVRLLSHDTHDTHDTYSTR